MLIVFALLFTIILLIMVGSVVILTRQGRFESQNYSGRVAALYAAEAGVADAVEQLNEDNTWAPDDYKIDLPNGKSSYRIRFAPAVAKDPNPNPDRSINNLMSTGTAAGPRGNGTVPAASVYLVIDGFSVGQSRRVEVVLRATPFRTLHGPFVTSGRIHLSGNVTVDGVKGFSDWKPVQAGLHSNLSGVNSDVITWTGQRGEVASISGEVTTSSVGPDAIDMNTTGQGQYRSAGEETGISARKFPRIDIDKIVAKANDQGVPTFTPKVGVNRISGGDKVYGGGTINGDLVLDGGNLYVKKGLKVNGSITGSGSVYVLEDTTFSGSADINVVENGHVAIYSKGHVKLDGFNGSDFLKAAADDVPDEIRGPLETTESILKKLQAAVQDGDVSAGNFGKDGSRADQMRRILGERVTNPDDLPAGVSPDDTNSLSELNQALANLPTPKPEDAKTVNFLRGKLSRLEMLTDNKARYLGDGKWDRTDMSDVDAFLANGVMRRGLLDYVNDQPDSTKIKKARRLIAAEIQSVNFDALGSSYFKGLIYTSGAVHSSNDIEIFGGIYAERTADSPTDALSVDGKDYGPGDTVLKNGCRVKYVKDLVENPASNRSRVLVVPVSWLVSTR
jgi:hypothetical protein